MNYNTELVKILLLLATAPLWWPFLRELWKELDGALGAEGGLLGLPAKTRVARRGIPSPPEVPHVTPLVNQPRPPPDRPARLSQVRRPAAGGGARQASSGTPLLRRPGSGEQRPGHAPGGGASFGFERKRR